MSVKPSVQESRVEIAGVQFIRTRHTRRDTDAVIKYHPDDAPPYLWRKLECVIVLFTESPVAEIEVDADLRHAIDTGYIKEMLFGGNDPEGFYWWKVVNTDFNFEAGSPDQPACLLTVMYTAWEKELIR